MPSSPSGPGPAPRRPPRAPEAPPPTRKKKSRSSSLTSIFSSLTSLSGSSGSTLNAAAAAAVAPATTAPSTGLRASSKRRARHVVGDAVRPGTRNGPWAVASPGQRDVSQLRPATALRAQTMPVLFGAATISTSKERPNVFAFMERDEDEVASGYGPPQTMAPSPPVPSPSAAALAHFAGRASPGSASRGEVAPVPPPTTDPGSYPPGSWHKSTSKQNPRRRTVDRGQRVVDPSMPPPEAYYTRVAPVSSTVLQAPCQGGTGQYPGFSYPTSPALTQYSPSPASLYSPSCSASYPFPPPPLPFADLYPPSPPSPPPPPPSSRPSKLRLRHRSASSPFIPPEAPAPPNPLAGASPRPSKSVAKVELPPHLHRRFRSLTLTTLASLRDSIEALEGKVGRLEQASPAHVHGEEAFAEQRYFLAEEAAEKLSLYHRLLRAWIDVSKLQRAGQDYEAVKDVRDTMTERKTSGIVSGRIDENVWVESIVDDLVAVAEQGDAAAEGERKMAMGAGGALVTILVCKALGGLGARLVAACIAVFALCWWTKGWTGLLGGAAAAGQESSRVAALVTRRTNSLFERLMGPTDVRWWSSLSWLGPQAELDGTFVCSFKFVRRSTTDSWQTAETVSAQEDETHAYMGGGIIVRLQHAVWMLIRQNKETKSGVHKHRHEVQLPGGGSSLRGIPDEKGRGRRAKSESTYQQYEHKSPPAQQWVTTSPLTAFATPEAGIIVLKGCLWYMPETTVPLSHETFYISTPRNALPPEVRKALAERRRTPSPREDSIRGPHGQEECFGLLLLCSPLQP